MSKLSSETRLNLFAQPHVASVQSNEFVLCCFYWYGRLVTPISFDWQWCWSLHCHDATHRSIERYCLFRNSQHIAESFNEWIAKQGTKTKTKKKNTKYFHNTRIGRKLKSDLIEESTCQAQSICPQVHVSITKCTDSSALWRGSAVLKRQKENICRRDIQAPPIEIR